MSRRDWGAGSITQLKDGRLLVRLRCLDSDDQAMRKTLGRARTRREAIGLLNQGRKQFYDSAGRKLPRGAADTAQSFVARWLEQVVKLGRASTLRLYAEVMKTRILPVIGQKRLDAFLGA